MYVVVGIVGVIGVGQVGVGQVLTVTQVAFWITGVGQLHVGATGQAGGGGGGVQTVL